jgi:hypothetical protein
MGAGFRRLGCWGPIGPAGLLAVQQRVSASALYGLKQGIIVEPRGYGRWMMWNIAAVMLIVVVPLALFVADRLATVQRRRRRT